MTERRETGQDGKICMRWEEPRSTQVADIALAESLAREEQRQALLAAPPGMSRDEQIRAKALGCAVAMFAGLMKGPESAAAFDGCKAEFETYIREGE